jgi:DNA-binding GntR family transcriptional regulator
VIRALADPYGISATPIGDALPRLVAEKSLEAVANRTIAVPHLTAASFVASVWRLRCEAFTCRREPPGAVRLRHA